MHAPHSIGLHPPHPVAAFPPVCDCTLAAHFPRLTSQIALVVFSLYAFICSLSFLADAFRLVAGRQVKYQTSTGHVADRYRTCEGQVPDM